jgi:hypothetical protein
MGLEWRKFARYIFSPLQVKNNLLEGVTKYAFIFGLLA